MKWLKELFKSSKRQEEKAEIEKDIMEVIGKRYNDYGHKTKLIYVTKDEYKQYIKEIIKRSNVVVCDSSDFIDAKIELDPAILREEKLNKLLK